MSVTSIIKNVVPAQSIMELALSYGVFIAGPSNMKKDILAFTLSEIPFISLDGKRIIRIDRSWVNFKLVALRTWYAQVLFRW